MKIQNQSKRQYYTSFKQKYSIVEKLFLLSEIIFSKEEGFEPLSQVDDLNDCSRFLYNLKKLDLTDNALTSLVLENFYNLTILLAPQNQIVDISLILPKLTELDLSSNMICKMFNLAFLPSLKILNLRQNVIGRIDIKEFLPVKKSLRTLNLSYNRIKFKNVNEFISFTEGLNMFRIEHLSLMGNKFIDDQIYFAQSYKTCILSKVKSIMTFNDEEIILGVNYDAYEEIKNQMLAKEQDQRKTQVQSTYATFESFYTKQSMYQYITVLEMTPRLGFQLTELRKLKELKEQFYNLVQLDITDNLITTLNLSSLPRLKNIIAANNRIKSVTLDSLVSLEELDLSFNMLCSIPDLSGVKGPLSLLNLNGNIIKNVDITYLANFEKSLNKLFLANNRIQFDNPEKEFTSYLNNFKQLSYINLDENDFTKHKLIYSNYVNSFIKVLDTKARPFYLDGVDLTNQTNQQMLINRRRYDSPQEENEEYFEIEENDYRKFLTKLQSDFDEINMILERLNNANSINMILYHKFLQKIHDVFTRHSYFQGNKNETIKHDIKFDQFLLNCSNLLQMNPDFEIPIFKIIAHLALLEKGKLFSAKCFFFFIKLSKMSERAKELIKKIVEDIIIFDLKDRDAYQISFQIVDSILVYLTSTEQSSEILYKNLIISFTQYLQGYIIPIFSSNQIEESDDKDSNDPEDIKNLQTCVNFIQEYLKIPVYINDDDLKQGQPTGENEESPDEEEQLYSDTDSKMSDDMPTNKIPSAKLIEEKYGFKIHDFQCLNNINIHSYTSLVAKRLQTQKDLERLQQEMIARKGNSFVPIYGTAFNQEIASFDRITDVQYIHSTEAENIETVKYFYIFLNSFKMCYDILIQIKEAFTCLIPVKERELRVKLTKLGVHFFIDLAHSFLLKKMNTDFKALLNQCDYLPIINAMRGLFMSFLAHCQNDPNELENSITEHVFHQSLSWLGANINTESQRLNTFKRLIPHLFECYGGLLSLLPEKHLRSELESDFVIAIGSMMNKSYQNEYILLGICKMMRMALQNEILQNDPVLFTQFMDRSKYFVGLLDYINENSVSYLGLYEKISISEDQDKKMRKDIAEPHSFHHIRNQFLIDVFLAIVHIYKAIAFLGLKHFKVSKVATRVNELLISAKLHELLSCILKISNDQLRKATIECLYYYDYCIISNDVMIYIIKIIQEYSSVIQGETEIILSIYYVILNRKLQSMVNNGDEKDSETLITPAVTMAMIFLYHNTNRDVTDKEEMQQKNVLTCALVLFLITASRFPKSFKKAMGDQDPMKSAHVLFKQILFFDYFYLNSPKDYIPIEIERTHFGCYLGMLFQTTCDEEALAPYSYPFLRILMKIADVLCDCDDFTMETAYDVDYIGFLENSVKKEFNQRFMIRVINEKLDWHQFSCNLFENRKIGFRLKMLKKKLKKERRLDMEALKSSMMDDLNVIDSKYGDNIFNINESKQTDNERLLAELTGTDSLEPIETGNSTTNNSNSNKTSTAKLFPKYSLKELLYEHSSFISYFPNMILYLFGQIKNCKESSTSSDISDKFDKRIVNSERILEIIQEYIDIGLVHTALGDITLSKKEIENTSPISLNLFMKMKTQFSTPPEMNEVDMRVDSLMNIANTSSFTHIYPQDDFLMFNIYENDMKCYELYGIEKNARRVKSEENANNPHLRSLIIVAFLRCCYAVIQSPSKAIRQNFVEMLFIEKKFKQIVLYMDTGLMFDYNVARKGLMVLQKIFEKMNMPYIIKACGFNCKGDRETFESRMRNKIKSKLFPKVENTAEELHFSLFEGIVFHNIYITSLYLEKLLFNYYLYYYQQQKSDPLFLCSMLETVANVFYMITQLKFERINQILIKHFILDHLAKSDNIKVILTTLDYLECMKRIASRKVQELKVKYIISKYTNQLMGVDEIVETEQLQQNTKNYLINYIENIENKIARIFELLAGMLIQCPNLSNKIWEEILMLDTEREEIIKQEKIFLKKDNDDTQNDYTKTMKQIKKTKFSQLTHSQRLLINQYYIKELRGINDIILIYDFCELYFPLLKEMFGTVLLVTNKELLLFHINQCEDFMKHSPAKSIFDTKSIMCPKISFKIEEIEKIVIHDYSNKIFIKSENTVISLTFVSSIVVNNILSSLRYLNGNIKIIPHTTIPVLITKLEQDDDYIKQKLNARNAIQKTTDKNFIFQVNHREIKERKDDFQNVKEEFIFSDAIEQNLYGLDIDKVNTSTFLISNEKMTFYDYITYFWRENQLLIKDQKVLFFSQFYLYLLKEDYSKSSQLVLQDIMDKDTINLEQNEIYEVLARIQLETISTEILNKNKDKMELRLHYKDALGIISSCIDVKFSHFYEFSLFKLRLLDAYERKWENKLTLLSKVTSFSIENKI